MRTLGRMLERLLETTSLTLDKIEHVYVQSRKAGPGEFGES